MAKKSSGSSLQEKQLLKSGEDMPVMTPEMWEELRALEAMKDSEIDTSDPDAPDLSAEEGCVRGKFYRPMKKPISIRIDMDVLDWFQRQEGPCQVLINKALRGYMESQKKSA